jgi:hypothetical protein
MDPITNFSEEEIERVIRDALKLEIAEKRKMPNKVQLNRALIGTIGEFLSCFKLMGYDLDGNPLSLTVYKEKIQKSAIDNMFLEEMGRFLASKSQ